ncbi:endonuclease/exonuclease/phosphatase family protein [Streptomyces griseoviridis]|uniref:endonuclease/exonuclease/phosphatase family protein n=1 Tax=Streptomyces griseoviridis TaxID=45398 RepID=UPI0019A37171|nr:endonuclease/exonuclease/phosphatase family protein [Streptomyces griseoviridis]GGS81305.1 hypothetical protein GCM10010240_13270 [Streptomyces griseoviridis]
MRVVTWNLWWRFGPWAERQKAVLAVLRELRPDVVGLQEVWAADGGGNLAEWLAGELGLHWAWAAYGAPERWQRRLPGGAAGAGVRAGAGGAGGAGVRAGSSSPGARAGTGVSGHTGVPAERGASARPGAQAGAGVPVRPGAQADTGVPARSGAPTHTAPRPAAAVIGNAVLSRWPVLEQAVLRLPAPEELDDGRVALHARLDAPGHPVPFCTAHLTSAPHATEVRRAQVAAVTAFVARHGRAAFPPVLTGDFNAGPGTDEIRLLAERGYRDAWDAADPAAPSATWDPANPYVTGDAPARRIDFIRTGPPGPGGLGRVRSAHRAGDGPVDGVWPSDHYAVVADLEGPRGL